MATYNGEAFLATQLRSILDQTRLPEEIVISDDQSSDDTVTIAKSFTSEASQKGVTLRVLTRKGTPGVASNFQHAVSKTTGALVALADQDDRWHPNKLAALERHFLGNPGLLMVHSDAALVDEAGVDLGMTVLESLRVTAGEKQNLEAGLGIRALVRRNLVTGSTAMLRRELVEQSGAVPNGWLHDEWWALIAASRDGLLLDPAVLQDYRQHAGNEVGATRSGLQRLIERYSEPQQVFRERHLVRHDGLRAHLDSPHWAGTAQARALLEGRLHHYAAQANLPASRWGRLGPVLRMALAGDYDRYRRGVFDAVRDLVQPG